MFGRMKDPAEGTATLVSYELTNAGNEFDTVIQAQLVVQAPGLEPSAVEAYHGVPKGDLPLMPGTVWKVKVDRKKPSHLKFLEDHEAAQAQVDAGRAAAAALAEQMRAQGDL